MPIKVAKFGGTSLASAPQIRKMQGIVQADPERRFVVPSAPGRRTPEDTKVTDLLYLCHELASKGLQFDDAWDPVCDRFREIVAGLGLSLDLEPLLDEAGATIADHGRRGLGPDYAASRGEAINGRIIAELLGCDYVDPTGVIFFGEDGRLDEERTYAAIAQRLGSLDRAVVPGFFGSGPDGSRAWRPATTTSTT